MLELFEKVEGAFETVSVKLNKGKTVLHRVPKDTIERQEIMLEEARKAAIKDGWLLAYPTPWNRP